jgi:hypothetical protein
VSPRWPDSTTSAEQLQLPSPSREVWRCAGHRSPGLRRRSRGLTPAAPQLTSGSDSCPVRVKASSVRSAPATSREHYRRCGPVAELTPDAGAARHARMLRAPNCKVNLDDLRWDCPHVDCEPQPGGSSLAIFNWRRCLVESNFAKSRLTLRSPGLPCEPLPGLAGSVTETGGLWRRYFWKRVDPIDPAAADGFEVPPGRQHAQRCLVFQVRKRLQCLRIELEQHRS